MKAHDVLSPVTVHGWKRTTEDRRANNRRRGRHNSTAGVLISAEHTPSGCGERFGLIQRFVYVRPLARPSLNPVVLFAQVRLFMRASELDGVDVVDPRQMRVRDWFVRPANLGPVVGFYPVRGDNDGGKHVPDFWARPQYVIFC
jgi:hypothetical protein